MSALAQDFVKGLDLTVQPTVNGADINQVVDAGYPASDKGLVITTTDTGATPDVPAAAVTTKWQRYFWRRIRTALSTKLYAWDANVISDATYLKWVEVGSSTGTQSAVVLSTYTALRAYNFQAAVAAGSVGVFVLGYATAGDGGHGEFRYDSTDTSSADDDGRVLIAALSSYRFKRVVAPGEYAKPEWFGGFPTLSTLAGAQAVTKACRKCIAYYRTLELGVGIYYIDNKIILPSNTKVRGQGKGLTTLRVMNAAPGVALHTGGNYYSMFMYCITGTLAAIAIIGETYLVIGDEGPCSNIVVENMSIFGNFEAQTLDGSLRYITNVSAVDIVGSNNRCQNLEIQACGKGYCSNGSSRAELFVIKLGTAPGLASNIGPIIIGCDYSNPGRPLLGGASLATYGWPTTLAGTVYPDTWGGFEATVFAVGCSGSTGSVATASNGIIQDCFVHDLPRSLTAWPNPINAMGIAGCASGDVSRNVVLNVDGRAYYSDNTQHANQITAGLNIHDNTFINVAAGVWLQNATNATQYKKCRVANNNIQLYAANPSYLLPVAPIGILLYHANSFTFSALYAFDDVVVENNFISGSGGFPGEAAAVYYSRGIYLILISGDAYRGLVIKNNTIDVPLFGAGAYYYQAADSLALYCFDTATLFNSTQRGGRYFELSLRNNRTPKGDLPVMTGTDGAFLPNFKYFQDDACIVDTTIDPVQAVATNLIDYAFPRSLDQSWFNSANKRLWKTQDTKRVIASGSLVPGRTYVVQTDDGAAGGITYDAVVYTHNQQFNAVVGINLYTLPTGYAKVYESPVYCWQPLTRNSYEVYTAVENTHLNYGITNDRFIDSRFFIYFNASVNGDHRIALPNPATLAADGVTKVYQGRTCFVRYGRNATADAHEMILACGTVAAGVLTPNASPVLVDPISCNVVDEVVFTPASKSAMGGIIGLLCDGDYWFITSQVADPQEILLYTQIGQSAVTPNDFELTNWAAAPFYHNISTVVKDRQTKGVIYFDFPLTGAVRVYLPDPANYVGYCFKLAIRVGNGFGATLYCGTFAAPVAIKLLSPLTANLGAIVSSVLLATVGADGIITCEVTSIGNYWTILCNT